MSHRCECHVTKPPATWPLAVVQGTGSPRLHHDWTVVHLWLCLCPLYLRKQPFAARCQKRDTAPPICSGTIILFLGWGTLMTMQTDHRSNFGAGQLALLGSHYVLVSGFGS